MPEFCEVALPVPLDRTFTYAVGEGQQPAVGGRVLVPFSGQRLMGVVVRLHDEAPADFEAKTLQLVMDAEPLLPAELMELAQWIAGYYLAPLGEVLRGMLPLSAEVRRQWMYRITDAGRTVLYEGAVRGSSRRSRLSPEEQNAEYAVLNYLESGEAVRATTLRSAVRAGKALLEGMVRKRWLVREAVAAERDARRIERLVVLCEDAETVDDAQEHPRGADARMGVGRRLPRLSENQLAALAELTAAGGKLPWRELGDRLRRLKVSETTVKTLVRRGLIRLDVGERATPLGGSGLYGEGKKRAHEHRLNEAQTAALAEVSAALDREVFAPLLLYGVTGSGKTAVYIAAMQRALAKKRGVLLLVPEIGLTPATVGEMYAAFGTEVALLHSALTPDERAEQWHRIRRGEARAVVGTRSAVFAPIPRLGLLIVDEEHDGSYKQEETPRYHGRDVAVMRARESGAVVVLGSATPSLESWHNAERGRYRKIEMVERVARRPLPNVELVDMRAEFRAAGKEELFSRRLTEETDATLARGEQVILLLNRRGYSFVVMCRSCGDRVECENCAIAMTHHRPVVRDDGLAEPGQRLQCHYCGFRRGVPDRCPGCNSEHLYFLGAGSQQGEERLRAIFPHARIGRMDRDTVRGRTDMERLLARLHSGEINLLVGTQMIAKGHDIHGVTLVGVVGADFALGLPDFRAAERVFQLLTQVSGRAGRGERPGQVLVQTYHPDHYAIRFARAHDYVGFAAKETQLRRWAQYPPFAVLTNVVVQSEHLEEAAAWSTALGRWFASTTLGDVRVLGPAQAPIARLKRIFRFHFVLRSSRRDRMAAVLRRMLEAAGELGIPRRNLVVDVDAISLM